MNKFKQVGIVEISLVTVLIFILGFTVFITYGHITQHERVTVLVVDKDIDITTTQSCNTVNDIPTCIPVTTTTYVIITPNESFTASKGLYNEIEINKRHVFDVSGWVNFRNIRGILE